LKENLPDIKDVELFYNLGLAYFQKGRIDLAEKMLEDLKEMNIQFYKLINIPSDAKKTLDGLTDLEDSLVDYGLINDDVSVDVTSVDDYD